MVSIISFFLKGHEGRNGFWRYICGLVLSRNQFLSWVCIVCTVSVRCQVIHVGQPLRTSSPWRLLLRSCEQFHGQNLRRGFFMLLCNNMFWNGLQWYLISIDTRQAEGLQLLENKAIRGIISLIQGLFLSPERGKSTCTQKTVILKKNAAFGRYPWVQLNRGYPWEGWRSSVGEPDLVTGGWWLGAVCFSRFNHVNYTCRTIHHPKQDVSTGELWIWNCCRECCSLSTKSFPTRHLWLKLYPS